MLLLTPGPVTTHSSVRAAAAQDYAPWDLDFRKLVVAIRGRVLAIAGGKPGEHVVLPLPGCGHFAMEAAVRSFMAPGETILVPLTGEYADWLVRLATEAGRRVVTLAMHAIVAFAVALDCFDAEGGQPARLARYSANMRVIYDGVRSLGLHPCLPFELQGPIVVNVRAPADPAWNLQAFVDQLKRRGILMSNYHSTMEPSFRIGRIGTITPNDMHAAIRAMDDAMIELDLQHRRAA